MHDPIATMARDSAAWIQEMDRDPLIGSVVRGDASREDYITFLVGTYHYVRWSGPILARTAAGLRRAGRHAWLADIFDQKTAEESPHDRWVLRDLEMCGENAELVKASPAPSAVSAYVAWSLTMADEGSPAFLGATYALELISMERAGVAAKNLRARGAIAGIDKAVKFLEGHGDADPEHVAMLHDVFRRLDDPGDLAAVALSAAVLRALYPRFFVSRAASGRLAAPVLVAA
jgi:pyrroloquinoline quinone (PQQ) biosynthesis protein C